MRELPPAGTIVKGKFKGVEYNARIVIEKTHPDGRAVKHDGRSQSSYKAICERLEDLEILTIISFLKIFNFSML